MARPPTDPSGAKIAVPIRLSPRALAELDRRRGETPRSTFLESLLAPVAYTASSNACAHPKPVVIGGGLKQCPDCEATKGLDGTWR